MPGGLLGDKGWGVAFNEDDFGAALHEYTGYADQGETPPEALVRQFVKILQDNPVLFSRMKKTIDKHPEWIFG